jgi:hypothetical protein
MHVIYPLTNRNISLPANIQTGMICDRGTEGDLSAKFNSRNTLVAVLNLGSDRH